MTKNAPAGVSIQRNSMLRRYMRRHWVLYAMLCFLCYTISFSSMSPWWAMCWPSGDTGPA